MMPRTSGARACIWIILAEVFLLKALFLMGLVQAQSDRSGHGGRRIGADNRERTNLASRLRSAMLAGLARDRENRSLKKQLAAARTDCEGWRKEADSEQQDRVSLRKQVARLQQRLRDLAAELKQRKHELLAERRARIALVADHKLQQDRQTRLVRELQARLQAAERELQAIRSAASGASQGRLAKELLGIRGETDKVVFLIDASTSMAAGNRWSQVIQLVQQWIRHLPVRRFAALVYATEVQAFPAGGGYLSMSRANRDLLSRHLELVTPHGETNLSGAIARALSYEATCWVLFSDGEPTVTRMKRKWGEDLDSQALRLLREHRRKTGKLPCINAVGLGSTFYRNERFSRLMMEIARISGGSFRAR